MNQVQQYGEAVLQPAPAFYNQLSNVASRVVELSANIAFYSFIAGSGVAILGKAVDLLCPYPPRPCLPAERLFTFKMCIAEKNTALVDPLNPPLDWNDRLEDVCKRELKREHGFNICEEEIHQEGVCYAAHKTVTTLQKGIDAISYIPNHIYSFVIQHMMAAGPARAANFICNRIFHRA